MKPCSKMFTLFSIHMYVFEGDLLKVTYRFIGPGVFCLIKYCLEIVCIAHVTKLTLVVSVFSFSGILL